MKPNEPGKWLSRMIDAKRIVYLVLMALVAGCASTSIVNNPEQEAPGMNRLVIHADEGKETINRNIYGHFSEHLGR